MSVQNKPNPHIVQEAAEWVEQIDDAPLSVKARQTFTEWLMKSPDHVNEFLLAATIFSTWDDVVKGSDASVKDILVQIAPEVVPISSSWETDENTRKQRKVWPIAACIGALGIVLGALFFTQSYFGKGENTLLYATTVGEQRSIPLADGSVMHLNTQSRAQINFTDKKREVSLLSGEALFQVVHDADRPFLVRSESATATVLGTKFNVYRQREQTTVSVLEGSVAVKSDLSSNRAASAKPQAVLTPGEKVTVSHDGAVGEIDTANLAAITSWRLRRLVFEREKLSTIVREYNRYTKTRIYIDSATLGEILISGVFMTDDPESLLSSLELSDNIAIDRSLPWKIRLYSTR